MLSRIDREDETRDNSQQGTGVKEQGGGGVESEWVISLVSHGVVD